MPNLAATFRAKLEAAGGTVANRTKNGIEARLPNGQRRLLATAGYRIHLDDGTEVDTDLDPDSGGWVAKARSALPYDIRIGDVGTRRFIPRKELPDEYIEFGRLQFWNGSAWNDVPLGGFERIENRIVWDQTNYAITIALLPETMKIEFLVKNSSADYPLRWPVSLVGLSWNAGGVITSDSDSAEVAWLKAPHWEDAEGNSGPVPWDYVGGYVRFDPDLTGAVFPVTIDPDVGVDIAAGADDGSINITSSVFDAAAVSLLVGKTLASQVMCIWLRFDGVTVPNGATISAATIDFVNATSQVGETPLTKIDCVADDDHAAPTNYSEWATDNGNLTGNAVDWDFSGPTDIGAVVTTSDFSAAVEAVVGRAGWASGQAIGVQVNDDGSSTSEDVDFASYENTTYDPPHLDVTWYEPSADAHSFNHWIGEELPPIAGYSSGGFDWWYGGELLGFINPVTQTASQTLTLTIYAATPTIYGPTVELLDQFLEPTLFSAAATIYGPTLDLNIETTWFSVTATIYAPSITRMVFIHPSSDVLTTGWDTYPVASQALYAQIDEDSASDADYIFANGV